MPELPEVETLRRDAEQSLVGRVVERAVVQAPEVLRAPTPREFASRLADARFTAARRRAKYLLLDLASGDTLALALAIYGQLLLEPPDTPLGPDAVVACVLRGEDMLVVADRSRYTRVWLAASAEIPKLLKLDSLGPEPLEPGFTPAALAARLGGRRAKLKALLLDQHVVAGLGNIYVDEALWAARLHPACPVASLTPDEIDRLHAAIGQVLRAGIADRGTTFHTYRDLRGAPGRHQDALAVFQRQGKPCPRCATPIQHLRVASRDTYVCPTCQPAP